MQHTCNRVATKLIANIMKNNFSIDRQNSIKNILGWGYANEIFNHLKKRKICNANNVPYSTASIRLIFNNQRSNDLVVKEIVKLYERTKARQVKEAEKRKNIFKK